MIFEISIIIAFITVLLFERYVKRFMENVGIVGIDQQKRKKPKIATSGGILVLLGVLSSGFFYIGAVVFLSHTYLNLIYLLAAYCSILIITLIGFLDDVNTRAEKKIDKGVLDHRVGLKQWQKAVLVLPAAVPLMAVKTGVSEMSIPLLGAVELGILYPLILVPVAILCVSNATNMLAGMNGLESGLGFLASLSIGIYSLFKGKTESALLSLSLAFSLLAFLRYNKYPARFLPGDSLTYLIGSVIVSSIIIGNIERFGIVIFSPWIIEAFLKLRSGFKARSLGDLQKDGTLRAPYKKIYSLTHIVMKMKRCREWEITIYLCLLELFFCLLAFLLYL